jgi:pimeloyl-ACP methyl ester carboxylesterase
LAGLNEDATGQVLQRMSAQIGEPLAVMDLPLLLRGLVHPALIFHDAQDLEIPFSDSVELAQAWTNSRLETVTNLGHRRILRSPFILEQSVNFVAQMIKG